MVKRAQLPEVYLIRALAILGVLMVHASANSIVALDPTSKFYGFYNFLNIAFRFGTPTFILLSSFVIFYNYYQRPFTWGLIRNFYQRRLVYIVLPYLLFSAAYYIYKIVLYYPVPEIDVFLKTLLEQILTGKAHAHLYFVFISIQFYLLFPLLLWLMKRYVWLTKHGVWLGFVLQWAFIIYNQYYLQYADKGVIALSYMSYYFLGAYMGIYYEQLLEWLKLSKAKSKSKVGLFWFALWAVWLVSMGGHVYIWYLNRVQTVYLDIKVYELFWNIHTCTSAIILFQVSLWLYDHLSARLINILMRLGVASFGIYLLHPFVLLEYERHFQSSNSLIYHLLVGGNFLAILCVSWLVVHLFLHYVPGSWIFFGSKPKKVPYVEENTITNTRQESTRSV